MARLTLPTGAAGELVIDPACLMTLRHDDVQSASLGHSGTERNVRAPSRH